MDTFNITTVGADVIGKAQPQSSSKAFRISSTLFPAGSSITATTSNLAGRSRRCLSDR